MYLPINNAYSHINSQSQPSQSVIFISTPFIDSDGSGSDLFQPETSDDHSWHIQIKNGYLDEMFVYGQTLALITFKTRIA